ncbi:uncharacterized protein LOC116261837 isoform X2 [Nymphaea colorata]|uniref:uncharacterized protein LOC116261837 isoform X2 n=1 Tax=Nymphaea colorata TaxID=210225 RepID=UPI00129EE3E9|nr:uncharacterized protein LOC116261837 isoform X2 [Nymphaea colorata]
MDLMEVDVLDPHPDIHELFCYYNALYFEDILGACLVTWSSGRMTLCAGTCRYMGGGSCEIRLSEPLLKFRSSIDLKNTLLHEMIHAYLFIKYNNRDHGSHGNEFQNLMKKINCSTVVDYQRPPGGYGITIYHNFFDEVDSYRVHHWMCNNCGDLVKRAMNREPSPNDCIQRLKEGQVCNHPSCHWHSHKRLCSGNYEKIAEPAGCQRKRSKRSQGNHGIGTSYSKELAGFNNENTKRVGFGDSAVEGKECSGSLKCKTLEKFFSILKNEPETEKHGSSPSREDLQRVDDLNELGAIEEHSGTSESEHPRSNRRPVKASRSTRRFVSDSKCRSLSRTRKQHRENIYTVIIKWKSWYAYEEESDSSEPLIDKRSEKKQKSESNMGKWLLPKAAGENNDLELNQCIKGLAEESTIDERHCSLNCNNSRKDDTGVPGSYSYSGLSVGEAMDKSQAFAVTNQGNALGSIANGYAKVLKNSQPSVSLSLESRKDEEGGSHAGARLRHMTLQHVGHIVEISESESDAE